MELYNYEYYHFNCGPIPYEDPAHWTVFFGMIADNIVNNYHPKTVLDAGCAMGYLVAALRDKGVEAYGVDISNYAISKVREDIKPYCAVGSLTEQLPETLPKHYDLVVTIEVLEHLSAEDGHKSIHNLCQYADTILFSSTPDDYTEVTHINVQQREYWAKIFAKEGFFDDLSCRPTYITSYASCFRKNDDWLGQLESYERNIQRTEEQLRNLEQNNQEKGAQIEYQDTYIAQLETRCFAAEQKYSIISNSFFWKITGPSRHLLDRVKKATKQNASLYLFLKTVKKMMRSGPGKAGQIWKEYLVSRSQTKPIFSGPSKEELSEQRNTKFERQVKFSILVPLYNTPLDFLKEMIKSVQDQSYQDWELCLADGSDAGHEDVEIICKKFAVKDKRIKYRKLERNLGISGNSNACIEMAEGDYLGLLDHDDLLHPSALYEVMKAICEKGADWDILYSDEDHLLVDGQHGNPFFKPDWSPDLLCSQMYICHFLVIKRKLFEEVNGFRSEFDGSQDYDLMLRLSEKTNEIYHIPKLLYTWRDSLSSTASNPSSKPYANFAGKNALNEHLKRVYGDEAHADDSEYTFVYDARYPLPKNTMVSIIIPMKDNWELTKACVESIVEKSTWKNYEILILNNRSEYEKTFEWFTQVTEKYPFVHIIPADMEFNWSKINNYGIKHSKGDVLIFLNNDTVVITPDWMERLSEKALRDTTGLVGPMLLYEDGSIQHGGVVVGMGGWADHLFKGMQPKHYSSPFVSPMVVRNVLAVTGACLAVSRKSIEKIGGFDESFIICGSDVELGIRAYNKKLYNVYDASVKLYHLESKTRDSYIPDVDFQRSYECYKPYREGYDPFFNPNLDINSTTPRLNEHGMDQHPEVSPLKSEIIEAAKIVPRIEINEKPRLNLLIPNVDRKNVFGGIATAIHLFENLCEKSGYERRIISTDEPVNKKNMALSDKYICTHWNKNTNKDFQVVSINERDIATLSIRRNDIFLATAWWTAYAIEDVIKWQRNTFNLVNFKPLLYFIQDYEPGFYPWSSRYLMAETTYRMNLPVYAIFNSSLLKEYLDKQGYRFEKAWCYEPTLNEELRKYLPVNHCASKKKQVLIYGRPNTPRNAFELICLALREFVSIREDNSKWIFLAAGEEFSDIDLGNGAVLHSVGKLTLQEYAEMMLNSYAGISLMVSPHPSYPPLEMATFGIKTITNCFANKDLSYFSDNIISVNICSEKEIAEKLDCICQSYKKDNKWNVNESYLENYRCNSRVINDVSDSIRLANQTS